MSLKVIFLDRDGVINEKIGYLHKIKDFKFIDKNFSSFHYLKQIGFSFIVITNQSGIARGKYSLDDFTKLNNWMISQFKENNIDILDTFFCPHSPEDNCNCRKPKSGLFHSAMIKYNVDIKNSWMIGDKEDDITAAISAGIENTILVRSGHSVNEDSSNAKHIIDSIKDIGNFIQ